MFTPAFIGMPGHLELIIFLFIVLIFFGKRLPSAMFSVGKSLTEFKKGMHDDIPVDEEAEKQSSEEKIEKKQE